MTYARWLADRRATWSWSASWGLPLLIMVGAGLWAVVGSMFRELTTNLGSRILAVVIVAPVVEEIMKVSLPMMVVETRPYFFKSGLQIALAALAGGFAFGVLENLVYLNVYIENPSDTIRWIRWTFCLGGHIAWSSIAGIGVWRMWRHSMNTGARPDMTIAAPWLMTAMIFHGLYNAGAIYYSMR